MLGRYLGFHLCKSITHSHACVAACTVFWNWDVTLFLADLIRQVETERTYLEQQSGDRRRLTEYIRRCHLHRAVRSSLSSSFITIHVIYYCSLTNVNNYNNNNNNCFLAETKPCLSEWGAVALISVVAGTLVRCMHACSFAASHLRSTMTALTSDLSSQCFCCAPACCDDAMHCIQKARFLPY